MKSRLTLLALIFLLVSGCSGMAVFETATSNPPRAVVSAPTLSVTPTLLPETIVIEAYAEEALLTNLYERANPSGVHIDVAGAFGNQGDSLEFGSGSGFGFRMR